MKITIADPNGEVGNPIEGNDGGIVQTAIFNEEGLNWVSFTYLCETDLDGQEIIPKDDEIEEARWLPVDEALKKAVSYFDIEAIKRLG